jgi:hypothetical protein
MKVLKAKFVGYADEPPKPQNQKQPKQEKEPKFFYFNSKDIGSI